MILAAARVAFVALLVRQFQFLRGLTPVVPAHVRGKDSIVITFAMR